VLENHGLPIIEELASAELQSDPELAQLVAGDPVPN